MPNENTVSAVAADCWTSQLCRHFAPVINKATGGFSILAGQIYRSEQAALCIMVGDYHSESTTGNAQNFITEYAKRLLNSAPHTGPHYAEGIVHGPASYVPATAVALATTVLLTACEADTVGHKGPWIIAAGGIAGIVTLAYDSHHARRAMAAAKASAADSIRRFQPSGPPPQHRSVFNPQPRNKTTALFYHPGQPVITP